MTPAPVLTTPELGLCVLVALVNIATRIAWSRVKGGSRRGQ